MKNKTQLKSLERPLTLNSITPTLYFGFKVFCKSPQPFRVIRSFQFPTRADQATPTVLFLLIWDKALLRPSRCLSRHVGNRRNAKGLRVSCGHLDCFCLVT